ncbi:MAG: methionine synthase [Planctomycetes bacterium]|nr:methionine synthase [Planctomycetota bacterium]
MHPSQGARPRISLSSPLLDLLGERVLILDGAMGTQIQAAGFSSEDFGGLENCSEILNATRPDFIRDLHCSYLNAGCDAVETNTFGANRIVLGEFGIADRTRELNRLGAQLAREACEEFDRRGDPRFVLGSIGPGTKLPTLGHADFDTLEASYAEQVRGLLDGEVDGLIIETCQDILQAKATLAGCEAAFAERGRRLPIICQVTMEATGTMLVGTEIGAVVAILEPYDSIQVLGLNCATGPQEMSEHVAYLGRHSPKIVSVVPNAGLPQLVGGKPHYPLQPRDFAMWLKRFVEEDGVGVVGGCCGTTADHIAALVAAVKELKPRPRSVDFQPALASLYTAYPIAQEASCFLVGERTNSNGSARFKKLLVEEKWEEMVAMAREQVKEGCHSLDVCVAHVDRKSEAADMAEVIKRYRTQITVPLCFDSTEAPVIEASLKLAGGRSLINSINLEDGEEKLDRLCPLARKFGAAVVALTIDEDREAGMAKVAARKLAIARRILRLATERHGLRPSDLVFDVLTFTICTGNESDRRLALETVEGIRLVKKELPGAYTILGVSNVSFGLKPAARHVLNSVFLHHAREAGLDAAIVHASKILPLYRIDPRQRQTAEDLIFDRRRPGFDPLQEFIGLFAEEKAEGSRKAEAPRTIEEKLKQRIVDGDRTGLEADLDAALQKMPALDLINNVLLDGMKVVGDLFGAGEMQLPFVLQSAETMKAAVAYLEPHLEKVQGESKGRLVLATVKGDVHDIGKNLVDIILTNNGYTVYNLGIKQPITAILEAAHQRGAHAIGLSGLLVKSAVVMKENLEEMNRQGIALPVILGGAALNRRYVMEDCQQVYGGRVFYAKDAFEGLSIMNRLRGEAAEAPPAKGGETEKAAPEEAEGEALEIGPAVKPPKRSDRPAPEPYKPLPHRRDLRRDVDVPKPPFWGARVVENIPLMAVVPYLNENALFKFQWAFRPRGRDAEEYERYANEQIRPILHRLLERCAREKILNLRAVYGYFPCNGSGEDLLVYDPETGKEIERFTFPRQRGKKDLCIADFFRPVGSGECDVVAFTAVTVGEKASQVEKQWFQENRYTDYFYLHGLSVETAEAQAEFLHQQIRGELGLAGEDARDLKGLFHQHYRGSRYSFGYPACPNLEDQAKLLRLLGAARAGITLSEEFQLVPEQSTTAVVVHHPQAKYFNV